VNHFLYFFPGERRQALTHGDLPAGHALKGCSLNCVQQSGGPGGASGMLLHRAEHDRGFQLRYDAANQTWIEWKQEGATTYWVGFWKDAKPGPGDLVRDEWIDGHAIKLGDDQEWEIPVCGPRRSRLPFSFNFATQKLDVNSRWKPLFAESEAWFEMLVEGKPIDDPSWIRSMAFALRLLSTNYHVAGAEATLLELLSNTAWLPLMKIATGIYDVQQEQLARQGTPEGNSVAAT
jgi:hypothetical protein